MIRVRTNVARRRKIQLVLNALDDRKKAKPVINRVGNPTVLPANVAEMNISMSIRHGTFVAWFSALANV